ncbi:MAG TPA: hypothetical protein VFQ90_18150 [Stellaceae bacterium]|jgi:hypothetical protein|nr:hypothetical protein [Stellaceae bacterium]
MNRQRDRWKEQQEVAVDDPLASMTQEQRFAQVLDIMARARSLLDATPDDDDMTDAEFEEVEDRGVQQCLHMPDDA